MSKYLPGVVFLTGSAVLIFQVAGIRFFAPFFGSGLTTTSSIIGVMLGALAIGYRYGGRLSDKLSNFQGFFRLIVMSGVLSLFLFSLHTYLLPLFAYSLQASVGVVLFSITLFVVPSIFLGTISPYAVKLASLKTGKDSLGGSVGDMFFWSTMGSIFGSLMTGFVLIPNFGVVQIMVSTSILLILLGLAGLLLTKTKIKPFEVLVCILLSLISFVFLDNYFQKNSRYVFAKDGVYQRLTVVDTKIEGEGEVRILFQDTNASSGVDLTDPARPVFDYAKKWEEPFILSKGGIKRVLIVGAGAYSLPYYINQKYPDVVVDVVDIEPGLREIATTYFNLSFNKNVVSHTKDARRYLYSTPENYYDYIFLDAFSDRLSIPPHLMTVEFFELVKSRLTKEGYLMANLIGSVDGDDLLAIQINTMAKIFDNYCVRKTKEVAESQNFIFLNAIVEGGSCLEIDSSFRFSDNFSPVEWYSIN